MASSMTQDKVSAILTLLAAIAILFAGYFQWRDITFNGKMNARLWVKIIFGVCIVVLLSSGVLLMR